MYVQYGCGMNGPSGWENFDASPTLRFERIPIIGRLYKKNATRFPATVRYGNIVSGLPCGDETCDAIYCSHVLEHLALDEFRQALRNTYRYLRKDGTFRLVMPDLRACVTAYLKNGAPDAGITFVSSTGLGSLARPRTVGAVARSLLGNSKHLWLWDYESTADELAKVGFRNIRRAQFGDSADAAYEAVEEEACWSGCLGIECKR